MYYVCESFFDPPWSWGPRLAASPGLQAHALRREHFRRIANNQTSVARHDMARYNKLD